MSIWNTFKNWFTSSSPSLVEQVQEISEHEKVETTVNDQITDAVTAVKPKRKPRKKKSEV